MLTFLIIAGLIIFGTLFFKGDGDSTSLYFGIIMFGFIMFHNSDNQTVEFLLAVIAFIQFDWDNWGRDD